MQGRDAAILELVNRGRTYKQICASVRRAYGKCDNNDIVRVKRANGLAIKDMSNRKPRKRNGAANGLEASLVALRDAMRSHDVSQVIINADGTTVIRRMAEQQIQI